MNHITKLEEELKPLRNQLKNHPLYSNLTEIKDIQQFMEGHVFAVWDFMSLVKALQHHFTCIQLPWMPPKSKVLARFINEIVHAEESDINEEGTPMSHFEMYKEAMVELGAETTTINTFLSSVQNGESIHSALEQLPIDQRIKDFVNYTFNIVHSNAAHKVAASFTFGREDVIPDMFLGILEEARIQGNNYHKLRYYLNRHIELDGDEHGPIALQMVSELCSNDSAKWLEVETVSKESLRKRIALWDAINDTIINKAMRNEEELELV